MCVRVSAHGLTLANATMLNNCFLSNFCCPEHRLSQDYERLREMASERIPDESEAGTAIEVSRNSFASWTAPHHLQSTCFLGSTVHPWLDGNS